MSKLPANLHIAGHHTGKLKVDVIRPPLVCVLGQALPGSLHLLQTEQRLRPHQFRNSLLKPFASTESPSAVRHSDYIPRTARTRRSGCLLVWSLPARWSCVPTLSCRMIGTMAKITRTEQPQACEAPSFDMNTASASSQNSASFMPRRRAGG